MDNVDTPDYSGGNPYQKLYIYYLEGRVETNALKTPRDFIGNWEEDGFSFLFFSRPASEQIANILERQAHLTLLDNYHMSYEQWQGAAAEPLQIGRFLIIPPWQPAPDNMASSLDSQPIILDPGLVFGTGTHATTHDCLEALIVAIDHFGCKTVLDLGTGTGLLSLAATRCGCDRCLAVDLNGLAATTAARNVRLNHWQNKIQVVRGFAQDFMDTPADLLIANIHYDIMRQLIRSAGFLTKKMFILSGLMGSEARDVRDFLWQTPVQIIREWSGDGVWHTFLGSVKNGN